MNIVVGEGIRAAIAETEKNKSKENQPLRQEEKIKLLQKERRKETGKQGKEQQLLALSQGERVKMKRYLMRNPQRNQNQMGYSEVGEQG